MYDFKDREVSDLVLKEHERQARGLELIASENYPSKEVLAALAGPFSGKYSEGYPGKRYYSGNSVVDELEELVIERAKKIFRAEHVNTQPLSGGPANLAVYLAFLSPGDTVLSLALDHGGHLSHGHPLNLSGKLYNFVHYHVSKETYKIDMDEVRSLALEHRPKMIVAGFSAYSRSVDWKGFREIADEVQAICFGDIAHIAGLIAAGVVENPVPFFDVVSTTTHKTLRGPRGAFIFSKETFAKQIDRAVFPGIQGGPHNNSLLAKAVALHEASMEDFRRYSRSVIENAQIMAETFSEAGIKVISGGTENHMLLLDVLGSRNVNGSDAQDKLEQIGIYVNKNLIPYDTEKPVNPSGIRLGSAALSTRGLRREDFKDVAEIILECLEGADKQDLGFRVEGVTNKYPFNN